MCGLYQLRLLALPDHYHVRFVGQSCGRWLCFLDAYDVHAEYQFWERLCLFSSTGVARASSCFSPGPDLCFVLLQFLGGLPRSLEELKGRYYGARRVFACLSDGEWPVYLQFPGGPPRSLEELKGRYYGVARALMVGRSGGEELIANEALVKAPFDVSHEQ